MLPEPIIVTLQVIEALDALQIPYLIGGSFASAVHGVPRATMDADIVAELQPGQVEAFAGLMGDAFYLDVATMRQAVQQRSSFKLIHLSTMFNVDIFVFKGRPYDYAQMAHRTPQVLDPGVHRPVYTASAEDTILTKLDWYRLGGEISERQWRDVLSVIKTQGDRLDMDYLRQWAIALDVADLLERSLSEASG